MRANLQTIQPLVKDMRKSSSDIDPLSSRAFNSFSTQEDYNRIYINGNTDFHTQASEKNWLGNGSQVAPYIIEDQVFTTNCFIYNTSLFFHLRNCFFNWSYRGELGFFLTNVTNAQLVNNTLIRINSLNTIHFLLSNSSHNSVINNTLNDGRIVLRNSPHNSLINNTLINSDIKISGSTLGDVLQFEVSNNSIDSYPLVFKQNITGGTLQANGTALILINCIDVEIYGQFLLDLQLVFCTNLLLHGNRLNRLQLTYCSDSNIQDNTITMEIFYSSCISLENSPNNQITNNTIIDTTISLSSGIALSSSDNNFLVNNTILNCSKGIVLSESSHTALINNFIDLESYMGDPSIGIELDNSKNTTILDNQLFGCYLSFLGIDTDDCLQVEANNNFIDDKPLIFWKNIFNNSVPADVKQIFLVNCSFIEVSHQNLSNLLSFYGISCSNLFIHDNDIDPDITGFGRINLDSTNDSIVTHNTLTYVRLDWCSSNIISYNTLSRLDIVEGGNNTVLANNFVRMGFISTDLRIYESYQNNISSNSVFNEAIIINGGSENLLCNNSVSITSEYYGGGGIIIWDTGQLRIVGNHISNSLGHGIFVGSTSGLKVHIMGNKLVLNAGYGIFLDHFSSEMIVGYNDFIGNHEGGRQACDNGSDNYFFFNYWDDWLTPDENNDEIVDIAYPIDGSSSNSDSYPRLVPFEDTSGHLLVPPKIIFPRSAETYSSPILISWIPAMDSMGHTITYSIFYSIDDGDSWISIISDEYYYEYSWNISSQLKSGTAFKLKVVAICSEGYSAFDITDESIIFKLDNQTSEPSSFLDAFSMGIIFILFTYRKKKQCKSKEVKK
ncbi:MAG: right-handed parallel beta-helix repeat-containing protein [Candidatus Heimdallarchaeota archaeon]|nr:MAG: right-handed parallel beta-helix repeat-containing protein [Candidatus Heimdallarchaeota archaeon]